MNLKERFYQELGKAGLCEDAARELESVNLLTDQICERYLIRKRHEELVEKQGYKTKSYAILQKIADEFSKTDHAIRNIIYHTGNHHRGK